jgi:hypothetical protein
VGDTIPAGQWIVVGDPRYDDNGLRTERTTSRSGTISGSPAVQDMSGHDDHECVGSLPVVNDVRS